MSGAGENAFDLLATNRKSNKVEKVEPAAVSKDLPREVISENEQGEESSWTVQSSAKTRRLVPQFTITKSDLGTDNQRSKTTSSEPIVKKKVTRFTKDEMLALRKPSKILTIMSDMLEIASIAPLDPVCFERLEPEDVTRIWNSERNNQNKDNAGRGRGRVMGGDKEGGSGVRQEGGSDWNRGAAQPQASQPPAKKGGLWDAGASSGMELSDFAQMAEKFRNEMANMKMSDLEGSGVTMGDHEEDMMERLLREQHDSLLDDELGGLEDEEDVPDWADDADETPAAPAPAPAAASQQKSRLLMESLHVEQPAQSSRPVPAAIPIAAPVQQQQQQQQQQQIHHQQQQQQQQHHINANAFATTTPTLDHILGRHNVPAPAPLAPAAAPIIAPPAAPVPAPQPEPEWLYTDPQGQVQGPFSQENMHLWHEAGYFAKDLPIRTRGWMNFHPFYLVFPDFKCAFVVHPTEPQFGLGYVSDQVIYERRRVEQLQQLEAQRQAAILKEQQRIAAERDAQLLREQRIREAQAAEQERVRQIHLKAQQDAQRLADDQSAGRQALLAAQRAAHDIARSAGPPPLVAARRSEAPAAQQQLAPAAAPAPVPLDNLKKIKISNIADLKTSPAAEAPAAAAPVHAAAAPAGKKQSGPPPLKEAAAAPAAAAAAAAPWASQATPVATDKASLAAIQKAEAERSAAEKAAERAAREAEAAKGRGKGWASQANAQATPAKGQSLAEIQEEEASRARARAAAEAAGQPTAAPLTMSSQLKSLLGVKPSGALNSPQVVSPIKQSWVAPTAVESNSAVSLRDIMHQEKSDGIAAAQTSGSGKQRGGPISWASKAGTGVNATNLAPLPGKPAGGPPPAAPIAAAVAAVRNVPVTAVAPAVAAKAKTAAASSGESDFGGKGMSREMSEWCAEHLRRLKGNDDLTLVQFCMTLDSPVEIRSYLSEYLGSNVHVANFASDFIKYKEGGKKALQGSSELNSDSRGAKQSSGSSNGGFVNAGKQGGAKKKASSPVPN